MATTALGFQNWYSTTLSTGITASETTIYLNSLPTPSEGYLVIEPDSVSNREIVYFTSKGANFVTCPSAALGRGVDGSTAASHSSGVTVQMNVVAAHLEALQDGTAFASTVLDRPRDESTIDFVASGGVWSGDAYASTRNASMTALVCYINGQRGTISAVTARSFTASKDTYIDVLNTSGVFTLVYTEVTNNAASPALASNSIRIGIIVTGASNIAAAGSVNQGDPTCVLPVASSIAYSVTDSLGNLICNRNPNPGVIGYRQTTTAQTTISTITDAVGLSSPVIVPPGRRVKITGHVALGGATANLASVSIYDGSTELETARLPIKGSGGWTAAVKPECVVSPSAGLHTYKLRIAVDAGGGSVDTGASTTTPVHAPHIMVELV